METLRDQNVVLCLAPQNIMEFWAVATRRRQENGLGMTHAKATLAIENMRPYFCFLPATPEVFEAWLRIVSQFEVTGKQTHDAHLVAAMQVRGISTILTFNGAHFKRFSGINVLDPRAL